MEFFGSANTDTTGDHFDAKSGKHYFLNGFKILIAVV
ncbi:hypothetical protein Bhyg_11228 [Pseudolycoriella hygida]|uniref:Uncharacterized protein n=1 Tax=Pseudolycoriella hygida TaxID=35572 RepID=A0A9Q0S033_9DIPT|nr:hypothetical protein Bhyg_11228 [Pseudolycoriella hygida]